MTPRAPLAPGARAATLTLAAFLAGWAAATWGLAWWWRAPWLWPLSAGALLLGLAGYRPTAAILWLGVRAHQALGQALAAQRARRPPGVEAVAAADAAERQRIATLAEQQARAAAELSGEPVTPEQVQALVRGAPRTGRG